jgi:hypothetical protein
MSRGMQIGNAPAMAEVQNKLSRNEISGEAYAG